MSLALLLAGCGEDIEIPEVVSCKICKKEVSSAGEACANCSHPIADSVDAYVKTQEEARIRREEVRRLAAIEAEEERIRAEEERKRKEEMRWLAEIRAKERAEEWLKFGVVWPDIEAKPEPYGGLEVLAKIKKAKERGATVLNLDRNEISDISPLAGLTKLESLNLIGNEISDLSPLKELTNLKRLWLIRNPIPEDQKAMLKKALPDCEIYF